MAARLVKRCCAFKQLEKMESKSVDLAFTDPPYGSRTHKGHDDRAAKDGRSGLGFEHFTPGQAAVLAEHLDRVTRGWIVVCCDHELAISYLDAFEGMPNRLTFAPIPLVTIGGRVRMTGDGPSSWTDTLVVSRPRGAPWSKWGTLDGAYLATRDRDAKPGSKPLSFCLAVVRDYSWPGHIVFDPFTGSGTIGIAAISQSREFLGFESDPKTSRLANRRLTQHQADVTLWRGK